MANVTLLSQRRDNQPNNSLASPVLSIVIAMYNEAVVISECHRRLTAVLDRLAIPCEIIYIDDGSTDQSYAIVSAFETHQHEIVRLRLSRNFGKEAAMSAGLQASTGNAVILLDADLQDPPELIPEMLAQWQAGFDVVDMQRTQRHGESFVKRLTARTFYKLMNTLSDIPIPENVGDFRLIDRRVVDQINQLPERTRFMKGLFAWPGFHRTTLHFERDARLAGETKWNYAKLCHLALEGITSFSTKPLRLATYAGGLTSLLALIGALVVFTKTIFWGEAVAGYPSTLIVMLLLGGIQLLSIGVLGEYVGRLFIEAKQRPLYVVMDEQHSSSHASPSTFHHQSHAKEAKQHV